MRRAGTRAIGIVLVVAGVVAAAVLWLLAGRRYDDAVGKLAPAPVGCTTTLQFDRPGTYTFFVETKGEIGEIDGNCDGDDRSYELDDGEVPSVELTLVDEAGRDVDLDRADGPSYDRAGQRGEAVQIVEITDDGEYRLTATAEDGGGDEAMIRVGRDPGRGVGAMRAGAVVALLAGLLSGVALLVLGGRRRATAPAAPPAGPQWPAGALSPAPTAPPSALAPPTPVYTPRPPSYTPSPDAPGTASPPVRPGSPPAAPPERPPGGWPGRGDPLPPPRPPA